MKTKVERMEIINVYTWNIPILKCNLLRYKNIYNLK